MGTLEKRLKLAGSLMIFGLLVELITLYWAHPTAFLVFAGLGGTLLVLGILLYLWTLVSAEKSLE